MERIIAIDPGVVNTGLVLMDDAHGVSASTSFRINEPIDVRDNVALTHRCEEVARRLAEYIQAWPHDAIVVEGYRPYTYRGEIGCNANNYELPWLCGYLMDALRNRGEVISIQYSDDVFRYGASIFRAFRISDQFSTDKRRRLACEHIEGGDKCKNDHERAAACHGWWYFNRSRKERVWIN